MAAANARSPTEIDAAADSYARDLTILGTAILTAIITRAARSKTPVTGGASSEASAAEDTSAGRSAPRSSTVDHAAQTEAEVESVPLDPDGFTQTEPPIKFEHVTEGEINAKGKAVGFHYRPGGNEPAGARMVQQIDPPNAAGVYTGKVQIKDPVTGQWIDKTAPSTFFPDNLSEQQIQDGVLHAYQNSEVAPNGSFVGDSGLGFPIQGWYRDGNIMSAYPLRTP